MKEAMKKRSDTATVNHASYLYGQDKMLYLFILPGLAVLLVFNYLPLYGITIAFKDFNPLAGIWNSEWAGLKHFQRLWGSVFFWRVLKNTLVINLMQLAFGFPAPIILALLINEIRKSPFKKTVQTITYLPHFMSWVIVGGFVVTILSPTQGIISQLSLLLTGERSDLFLMIEPAAFPWILVFSHIWQSVGWGSIIFIAAISSINPDLYEAAIIDGANRWRQMWNITIPCLMPTIFVILILRVGRFMEANFEQIFVLLNPNVYSTGDVISTYVFREGLSKGNFSYTAAIGFFQSAIGFVLMVIVNRISKRLDQSLW
jgi:putative aldouronate transport system permease protein